MESIAELDQPRTVGLVLHLLEGLNEFEKRISGPRLLLARYYRIPDPPRLFSEPTHMKWEFDVVGNPGGENAMTVHIGFDVNRDALSGANGLDAILHAKVIKRMNVDCECNHISSGPCEHVVACVTYLRQQLSSRKPEAAIEWIQSTLSDGREIGKRMLNELVRLQQDVVVDEPASRIQWRIEEDNSAYRFGDPIRIVPYLQQAKKKGGWTKGKRVRDIFQSAPAEALSNPHDRIVATMVQLSSDEYGTGDILAIREALLLLKGHSNVVFDDECQTPARIEETAIEVRIEQEGEVYRPSVYIGSERIDIANDNFIVGEISSTRYFGIILQRSQGRIWVTHINQHMRQLIQEFRVAARKQAKFDYEMASQLADLVAKNNPTSVQLNLPESLAGPEVPLEPTIEVHMQPAESAGLAVTLRVACDATTEPPVPGIEPQILRISTPAGRYQLVRDLDEETRRADAIVAQLNLGKLAFEGPYSWIAASDDEALELIQHIQELGDVAPTVCWPKSKAMRLVGEITPQRLQVRLTSQRDWFGLEGLAAFDGIEIPLAELLAALRSGRRFVPVGEGQFAAISDQLRQRLTAIHDISHSETGAIRISRAATPILEEALGSDISYESDQKWHDALARLKESRSLKPVPPKNLNANLRDYQVLGYEWLARLSHWGLGGCLADDMGLGKTVQALGILLDRASKGPALVIAPTSVGTNWLRECHRFAPDLKPKLYREHDRQHLIESATVGELVITSYQLLQRDAERFASRPWYTLVLDEAQFIKNFQTKTAQAVRQLDADWCLALTGTPLENHLGELWSLMRVVSPGLLGSWERFRKSFAEPVERDRNPDRLKALGQVVKPFILRRTKKDVLTELPPRTEVIRFAELSTEERKKYDAARLAALSELTNPNNGSGANEQQQRIKVLAWLTRLRQLSCHPRLVDERWTKSSAKLDMFLEILEELREGEHRALVFSQFVQHLTIIREALDRLGVSYQYLDGSTPVAERQRAVDSFQAGEGELFLISLKAGGTGLNLTAADYVLHLDPWWNPAVEDQATDRAHRIGQERPVTVYRLVAKDTIEEQILAMHADKRELIAGVLDGADRAARLSTNELVQLIRLSQVQSSE